MMEKVIFVLLLCYSNIICTSSENDGISIFSPSPTTNEADDTSVYQPSVDSSNPRYDGPSWFPERVALSDQDRIVLQEECDLNTYPSPRFRNNNAKIYVSVLSWFDKMNDYIKAKNQNAQGCDKCSMRWNQCAWSCFRCCYCDEKSKD